MTQRRRLRIQPSNDANSCNWLKPKYPAHPRSSGFRSAIIRSRLTPRCRRVRSRRSEEHTSELQSQFHLVCRLLLEKKKKTLCALHLVPPPRSSLDARLDVLYVVGGGVFQ